MLCDFFYGGSLGFDWLVNMCDNNCIIEGTVKFRDGKKVNVIYVSLLLLREVI